MNIALRVCSGTLSTDSESKYDPRLLDGIKTFYAFEPLVKLVQQLTEEEFKLIETKSFEKKGCQIVKNFFQIQAKCAVDDAQKCLQEAATLLIGDRKNRSSNLVLLDLLSDLYNFERSRVKINPAVGPPYKLFSRSEYLSNYIFEPDRLNYGFASKDHSRIIMYRPEEQEEKNVNALQPSVTIVASPSVTYTYHLFSRDAKASQSHLAFYLRHDYLTEYRRNHSESKFMEGVVLNPQEATSLENDKKVKRELVYDILKPVSLMKPLLSFPEIPSGEHLLFLERCNALTKVLHTLAEDKVTQSVVDQALEEYITKGLPLIEKFDSSSVASEVAREFRNWSQTLRDTKFADSFDRELARIMSIGHLYPFETIKLHADEAKWATNADIKEFKRRAEDTMAVFLYSEAEDTLSTRFGRSFRVSQQNFIETDPEAKCQKFVLFDLNDGKDDWWVEGGCTHYAHFYINKTYWTKYFLDHPGATNFFPSYVDDDDKKEEEAMPESKQEVESEESDEEEAKEVIRTNEEESGTPSSVKPISKTPTTKKKEVTKKTSLEKNNEASKIVSTGESQKELSKNTVKINWKIVALVIVLVFIIITMALVFVFKGRSNKSKAINIDESAS